MEPKVAGQSKWSTKNSISKPLGISNIGNVPIVYAFLTTTR